jgi:excisionase family DNA binding protein
MIQKRTPQRSKSALTKSDKSNATLLPEGPGPLVHPVYTTAQVAAALRLSTRTILRAIVGGHLEARKVGKLYLIAQDAVQRFWESLPLATEAPKTVGRPKQHPSPPAATDARTEVSVRRAARQESVRRPAPAENTPKRPRGRR